MNKFIISLTVLLFCIDALLAQSPLLQKADSLFFARDWTNAKTEYETHLPDTVTNPLAWNRLGFTNYNLQLFEDALKNYEKSLSQNPQPNLKASVFSRMAKIHAIKGDKQNAYKELDSAVSSGYIAFTELDTLSDFNSLRQEQQFKDLRERVYVTAYPCMGDKHAREFDFWIGEWDVYPTGAGNIVGHSLIEMISGGCALLENWDSPNSTGKSINFIDPVTNKWKQSWAGSYAQGIQEFVDGEYSDGAMRFTFETTDAKGTKQIGRFMFFNVSADTVRQFNETSSDNGKTWTTNYDFTYVRKK